MKHRAMSPTLRSAMARLDRACVAWAELCAMGGEPDRDHPVSVERDAACMGLREAWIAEGRPA